MIARRTIRGRSACFELPRIASRGTPSHSRRRGPGTFFLSGYRTDGGASRASSGATIGMVRAVEVIRGRPDAASTAAVPLTPAAAGHVDHDLDHDLDLAGRLDTVLGRSPARLVASHDREELFRMIVDETHADAAGRLHDDQDPQRATTSKSPRGPAWTMTIARRLPPFRQDEGWPGEVIRTGRAIAWSDVRAIGGRGFERYAGVYDFVGLLVAPLIHHGRVIGALSARVAHERAPGPAPTSPSSARWPPMPRSPCRTPSCSSRQRRRAAQLEMLQAASARMSRAGTVEQVGRTVVEETRRIIDYHNARVYLLEPPDLVVPIAFEGAVGAYERVDMARPAHPARRGLHRLGRPARRAAAGQRRQRRLRAAARSRGPTRSTSRCWSCRCATTP